jgi:hypothetical protein
MENHIPKSLQYPKKHFGRTPDYDKSFAKVYNETWGSIEGIPRNNN